MQPAKINSLILMLTFSIALLATGCKKAEETTDATAEQTEQTEQALEQNEQSHDHGDHAGHDHGDHAGHDHGDHAGHDHGDHAGHDHGDDDIMDLVLKEGEYDEADVVRQPGAKIGDLVRCTVSGEAFVVTDRHTHVTHEGEEVYFCCPGCIRRFQRNPQQYIDGQK